MNKKLICMAVFSSLFAKSFASEAFLKAPEDSENLVNSVIDYIAPHLNSSTLNAWPLDESPLEIAKELVDLFENGEDFGEAIGEDIINFIEGEDDFSLLGEISQLEKIAVPALAVTGLVSNPEIGTSVGTILALGELVNEASALAGNSTVDNAVLAGTVGSIADQALGISGNTGAGLIGNLGANAIGNLVKDFLNAGETNTNMDETLNTLGDLANSREGEAAVGQLDNALGNFINQNLISSIGEKVGDVLGEAGEAVESVIDEVKGKAEDLSDVKENLGDKMKEAAGKIGKFFGKN